MMETDKTRYAIGDMVFAAEDIFNDGGMPGIEDADGLIAPAGLRGVVVHYGVAEMDETQEIYLVQFENGPDGSLGQPVGCLPEELTQAVAVDG
jgi:nitrogen fixation protein NifZ